MSGPLAEHQLRLHRDALSTPWGFRLLGGKDFKAPLSVQRVFVGSPADGELHRGDLLVQIDNYDTNNLTHKQAQDVIKQGGGSISLRIRRSAGFAGGAPARPSSDGFSPSGPVHVVSSGYRSQQLASPSKTPASPMYGQAPSYGTDYNRPGGVAQARAPGPDQMLGRVHASLANQLWSPDDGQAQEDYSRVSVRDMKQQFAHEVPGGQAVGQVGYAPKKIWAKPVSGGHVGLNEPGWAPGQARAQPSQDARHMPHRHMPQAAPEQPTYYQQQTPHRLPNEKPAWQGTLRKSGSSRPWEMAAGDSLVPGGVDSQVPTGPSSMPRQAPQAQAYQPQQPQQYQQPAPQMSPGAAAAATHTPRVQNVHYAPGESPQYQQRQGAPDDSDTATVVHNQYNSPLGLYSRANVESTLTAQTSGKPGQGTLQVTGGGGPGAKKEFNPAQSDVYRFLQEEKLIGGGLPRGHARAEHHQQPQGQGVHQEPVHVDSHQRSPMMHALEQYCEDEGMGTSDF